MTSGNQDLSVLLASHQYDPAVRAKQLAEVKLSGGPGIRRELSELAKASDPK
jgi:hypothetical protein